MRIKLALALPEPKGHAKVAIKPGFKIMYGGITFRQAIDNNKAKILAYLMAHGKKHTSDIARDYGGEKELPAVRKALNELRKEGKIQTDDKVYMWQGKQWWVNQ